jgi:hypothetical protein
MTRPLEAPDSSGHPATDLVENDASLAPLGRTIRMASPHGAGTTLAAELPLGSPRIGDRARRRLRLAP